MPCILSVSPSWSGPVKFQFFFCQQNIARAAEEDRIKYFTFDNATDNFKKKIKECFGFGCKGGLNQYAILKNRKFVNGLIILYMNLSIQNIKITTLKNKGNILQTKKF